MKGIPNVLVDSMEKVVNSMQVDGVPYYLYGHRLEIANILTQKGKDSVLKYQRYPLIALRMDFAEKIVDDMYNYSLNIAIVTMTQANYSTQERYEKVFKPTLYPLYLEFLNKLRTSGQFTWKGSKIPEHTKYDRPFYGIAQSEKNVKNIFTDPLDAIELIDLKINQNFKTC